MPFHAACISSPLPRQAASVGTISRPRPTSAALHGLAIAAVIFVWSGQTLHAQGAQAETDSARAQRLIDDVIKVYEALPAYVDYGQESCVTRFRGKRRKQTSPVSLAFARPNRLALRCAETEIVCDGKQLSIAWNPFRRFIEIKAPESIGFSTFDYRMDEVTRQVAAWGDPLHFRMVMALLSGKAQAAASIRAGDRRWVVEPDRMLSGKMLHSLLHTQLIDVDMQGGMRLLVDPETKLIRGIQEFPMITEEQLAELDKQGSALRWDIERSWTASSIQTGAAPADLFAYRPAQNFTRVGNFKYATQIKESMFSKFKESTYSNLPVVLPGRPAGDFTFNITDNAGSIRKVSKSDLAGKIVVIAYWSMHDDRSLEELQQIRKIIQAAHAENTIVLVALNVDQEPEDLNELSARVRQVLKQKNVDLEFSPGYLIAVDPSGATSELLPAAGVPALVVLDGKGIVQSFDKGTGEELRGGLLKEIQTLLAGKPLETPELKALGRVDADESRPTFFIKEPAAFKKIEELGGIVIPGGGDSPSVAEIDIPTDAKGSVDELLAKLAPHLKQIERISCLHLQNTRVTDAGLDPLKGMSNIASISLENTSISDRGLDSLKTISSLNYVVLTGTRVTEDGVFALIRAVPGLRANYSPVVRGNFAK
jgi:hypothetical protein